LNTQIIAIICLSLAASASAQENIESLSSKLDALTMEIQNLKQNSNRALSKFSFGGYGEFIYTDKKTKLEDGTTKAHTNNPEIDAQRFIIYTGFKFNEKWSLSAELEIEHVDSIYLEQAYLENYFSDKFKFQVGVIIVPVGITNLYHEPTAFHSVERAGTDNAIIPSTWREMGMGFSGSWNKLSYKLYAFNSLNASAFTKSGVREGRKKAKQAEAGRLSYVGRIDYSILPSVDLGASYYLGKGEGVTTDVKHNVWDIHLIGKMKGISVKAMYAETNIDGALALNNEITASVAEKMSGYYVDVGYNVFHGKGECKLTPFVMYEAYNTQDTMPVGFTADDSKNIRNITYGINYNPIANIVFKADYMKTTNQARTGFDTWSLGAGWNF
jgi:hypothetical protein